MGSFFNSKRKSDPSVHILEIRDMHSDLTG